MIDVICLYYYNAQVFAYDRGRKNLIVLILYVVINVRVSKELITK